jgi:periplasmic protein TonB
MISALALWLLSAHPAVTVYFQSNLTDTAYQRQVFAKVMKAFAPPKASHTPKAGNKAVVQAVIASDGKLASVTVSMESGSKAWDAAALAAVNRAAPFPPLPRGFTAPTVDVHFHFAWAP